MLKNKILVNLLLVLLIGFNFAYATENKEIDTVFNRWVDAINNINNNNLEEIKKLYDKQFMILPPFKNNITEGIINNTQDFTDYLSKMTDKNIKISVTNKPMTKVYDNIAINTGTYNLTYYKDNQETLKTIRVTFVYKKDGNDWLIVHEHSSELPENNIEDSSKITQNNLVPNTFVPNPFFNNNDNSLPENNNNDNTDNTYK